MKKWMLVPIALALSLPGCTTTHQLGLVARTGVTPEMIRDSEQRNLGPVAGKACRNLIFGFFPVGNSSLAKAAERAMAKVKADLLVNAEEKSGLYAVLPIWVWTLTSCTAVEGTAIKLIHGDKP